jgi:dihydrofolate reductase (trimethoprim resistance protein)
MPKFQLGDVVRKISGSMWQGAIVGTYSTSLTPEGYAVESSSHRGSVQIYPASALELVPAESAPGTQKDDRRRNVL